MLKDYNGTLCRAAENSPSIIHLTIPLYPFSRLFLNFKYINMALCLQCNQSNHNQFFDKTIEVAEWIKRKNRSSAIPPNAPPPSTQPFAPNKSTIKITLSNTKLPKGKILFWGSKPAKINDTILDASKSYGKYTNMGIAYVDKKGGIIIKCQSPSPYKENGKVWPPHIHFVTQNNNKWDETVYVVAAYPGQNSNFSIEKIHETNISPSYFLTPRQVKLNWNNLIIVNALDYNEFNIKHNGNARPVLHLPYNSTDQAFLKVASKIKNKPYVVYCANPVCGAAHTVINKLVAAGCNKVYYMPAGFDGWNKII
jgi:rhodanese-related sulfurtransferase